MLNDVYKAISLFKKELGYVTSSDGETVFETFQKKVPIMFKDNKRDIIYSIHYTDDHTASVAKILDNRQLTGTIYQTDDAKFYDALSAFIVNAKNDRISWGCGKLGLAFPDFMPPDDLSFSTYLKSRLPVFKDRINYVFRIILVILILPILFAKELCVTGTAYSTKLMSLGILFLLSSLCFVVVSIAFSPSMVIGYNIPYYYMFESYCIILYMGGLVYYGYVGWKKEWSN